MLSHYIIFHLLPEAGFGHNISPTNSFVQKRASLYLAIGFSGVRLPRPVTSNNLPPPFSFSTFEALVIFPNRSVMFPKILQKPVTVDTWKPIRQCAKKAVKRQLSCGHLTCWFLKLLDVWTLTQICSFSPPIKLYTCWDWFLFYSDSSSVKFFQSTRWWLPKPIPDEPWEGETSRRWSS